MKRIVAIGIGCVALAATTCFAHVGNGVHASVVKPVAAAAFNDSIGVNTHLNFAGSRYDVDYHAWAPVLLKSRIKHVRDGFCNWGTASAFCTGNWKTRFNQFASAGITFDIITDPWMGWTRGTTGCHGTCLDGYSGALGLASTAVEAYEGPNECDDRPTDCTWLGTTSGLSPRYVVAKWVPLIWNLRSRSVSIFSPAMASSDSYQSYPYIGNYTHYCAVHDEVNGAQTPELSMANYYPNFQAGCKSFVGREPLVGTESNGWNTDTTTVCKNGSVDQLTQERYFPRDLLLHIENGVRVYSYELLDEFPSGRCAQYGLIDRHFKPKLVWARIAQLMRYFADSGTSLRTPLAYSLAGDSTRTLHQVLFQKSDGTYILVPWLGTQLWQQTSRTDDAPITETLTLILPASVRSITVTKFGDKGSMAVTTLRGAHGTFQLRVGSLIEAVRFRVSCGPSAYRQYPVSLRRCVK